MSLEQYTATFEDAQDQAALQKILLSLAKQLPDNYSLRTNQNYMYGCQSDVWLAGSCENNRWRFSFDSNSLMVKGIGKIVLDCFNDLTADEIRSINFFSFKNIASRLPHERQRGLQFIINRIHTIVGDTQ
jgi:cysteine desulfuration protein SufE